MASSLFTFLVKETTQANKECDIFGPFWVRFDKFTDPPPCQYKCCSRHLTERAHFIWLVMIKMPFFTSEQPKRYKLWSCQKMCDALHYLLDNIFIRFGSKLYRQIVGIPMGTNCAPLVADLFLFCYERDFMLSLSDNNQADIIEAFKSTSRYLDDLLNIDNPYLNKW